jgi:ABC-2 type transport system ATP-binding protein
LEQVQEVCDNVGILYQGCLIADGTMEEITSDRSHTEVSLRNPSPELLEQIRALAGDAWQGAAPARNSLESVFLRGIQAKLREQQR